MFASILATPRKRLRPSPPRKRPGWRRKRTRSKLDAWMGSYRRSLAISKRPKWTTTKLPRTTAACASPMPPLFRTNRDSGGVLSPTGAAHPRNGVGDRDRGGLDEESLLITLENTSATLDIASPRAAKLPQASVGSTYP